MAEAGIQGPRIGDDHRHAGAGRNAGRHRQETLRGSGAGHALPDVTQRVLDMGADVIVSTPQQFTAQIKHEVAKWTKVIKAAGIKVE